MSRAQSLLRRIAEESPPNVSRDAAERDRGVARIEATLRLVARDKERARARRGMLAALALAATVLLVAGAVWRPWASGTVASAPSVRLTAVSGDVFVAHRGGGAAVFASDGVLAKDDRVVTSPGGRARLVFPSGATVELEPATEVVAHLEEGEHATVSSGLIQVHVPKLGPLASFAIDTPNAVVTVHGTTFEVRVQDGEPRTHVHVSEGRVSVVSPPDEVWLEMGQSWPAAKTTDAPAPTATEARSASPRAVDPIHIAAPTSSVSPSPASTLADQNRLLQSALAARREGRDGDALARLDELLRAHPSSPLAQEARVERFRALERLGRHDEAVAEARAYLTTYPDGFARDEARTIVH